MDSLLNVASLLAALVRAFYTLTCAILRCWVVVAISALVSLMLLRPGQGLESIVADLLVPKGAGVSLFIASLLLVVLVFFGSSLLLVRWRIGAEDKFTTSARYTAPLALSMIASWVMPVLLIDTRDLRPEEL